MSRRHGGASPEGAHAVESSAAGLWHRSAAEPAVWHHGAAGDRAAGAGLGDQAELAGPGDGLGAVGRAELARQVADVLFHRVEADHQLLGDARVRGGFVPRLRLVEALD